MVGDLVMQGSQMMTLLLPRGLYAHSICLPQHRGECLGRHVAPHTCPLSTQFCSRGQISNLYTCMYAMRLHTQISFHGHIAKNVFILVKTKCS